MTTTSVKLSYEYFHDDRTSDRGNPSQALPGSPVLRPDRASIRRRRSRRTGIFTAFFGSPTLNKAIATVQTGMAIIEHDFGNGLTVRNGTIAPTTRGSIRTSIRTGGPFNGGVISGRQSVQSRCLSTTPPIATTSSTRPTSPTRRRSGRFFHTIGFGTEFGRQTGVDIRNTGVFPNGTPTGIDIVTESVQPDLFRTGDLRPSYTASMRWRHDGGRQQQISAERPVGLCRANRSRSRAGCNSWSARVTTVSIMSALDMNTNINRARLDNLVSPRAAVIVKPMDNLSIYTRLEHLLSAGIGRPVQRAESRHADPGAAEIREQRSRRQVEHQSEAAVHGRGL